MEFPDIPDPDELWKTLLGSIFGPASLIVFLFVAIKWALAWYEAAQSAIKLGKAAGSAAVRLFTRLSATPAGYRRTGLLLTSAMVLLQICWLGMAFVVGCVLSMSVGLAPGGTTDLTRISIGEFFEMLRPDWLSGGYVGLCVLALIYAYRTVRERDKNNGLALAIALPTVPFALFGTLGTALMLLDYYDLVDVYSNVFTSGQVFFALGIGAAAFAYIYACRAALNVPALVARYWRQAPATPPPPPRSNDPLAAARHNDDQLAYQMKVFAQDQQQRHQQGELDMWQRWDAAAARFLQHAKENRFEGSTVVTLYRRRGARKQHAGWRLWTQPADADSRYGPHSYWLLADGRLARGQQQAADVITRDSSVATAMWFPQEFGRALDQLESLAGRH